RVHATRSGTRPAPSSPSRRKAGTDVPIGDIKDAAPSRDGTGWRYMKHASTRALFEYWNEKRGNRPAPEREDIDPTAIRHALGDTFMLAADFVNEQRFRLAGTRICALYCRELKGETFAGLWNQSSRAQIAELLSAMTSETIGAVAGVTGRAENGAQVDLELLILPLAH